MKSCKLSLRTWPQHTQSIVEAVSRNDFAAAAGAAMNNCVACHAIFRFAEAQ